MIYKRVVQAATFPEAGLVRSLLVANGLHPPEVNAAAHVTVAGADQVYYVELPEEEVDVAREVLRDAGMEHLLVA